MSNDLTPAQGGNDPPLQTLIAQLRNLVRDARANALRAVDAIQVRTCWEIGRHIVEFEQGGAARAEYGKRLLPRLAESLTAENSGGDSTRPICAICACFIRLSQFVTHCVTN